MGIKSFKGQFAELILTGRRIPKGLQTGTTKVTRRKLAQLDAAESLDDLRALPGNRLESLAGNLAGKHSIRINDQWRIVFRWTENGPEEVEVTDYH